MEKLRYLSTLVMKKLSMEMENTCLIKISGVKTGHRAGYAGVGFGVQIGSLLCSLPVPLGLWLTSEKTAPAPSLLWGWWTQPCPGWKNSSLGWGSSKTSPLYEDRKRKRLRKETWWALIWISRALGANSSRKDSHPDGHLCSCKGGYVGFSQSTVIC